MAKTFASLALAFVLSLHGREAGATSFFITANDTVVGHEAAVVVGISDASDTVGAFDVSLLFDPRILEPVRIVFPSALGLPDVITWGYDTSGSVPTFTQEEVLDPSQQAGAITGANVPAPDALEAFEVSLLQDSLLDARQGLSFPLVVFIFKTLRPGVSRLEFPDPVLVDGLGNTITATIPGSSLTVNAIPEPATLLLLTSGLALVALRVRPRSVATKNTVHVASVESTAVLRQERVRVM